MFGSNGTVEALIDAIIMAAVATNRRMESDLTYIDSLLEKETGAWKEKEQECEKDTIEIGDKLPSVYGPLTVISQPYSYKGRRLVETESKDGWN